MLWYTDYIDKFEVNCMIGFLLLIVLVFIISFGVQLFFYRLRRRILVQDIKQAIIEAEYEIRRGNFDLK